MSNQASEPSNVDEAINLFDLPEATTSATLRAKAAKLRQGSIDFHRIALLLPEARERSMILADIADQMAALVELGAVALERAELRKAVR